jgi:hypothetical protein
MEFVASYREDTPVKVAIAALALLATAVGLTFLFQIFGIGSPYSLLDRLMRLLGTTAQIIGTVIVWLMALVAMLVMGAAVLMLRDRGPMLRLDRHGVMDRRWSSRPVGWLNIAEFDPVRLRGVDMVLVRLKNPAADPPDTWLARLALRIGLIPPDTMMISTAGLECGAPDLCARILEIGTPVIQAAEDLSEDSAGASDAGPAATDAPDGAAMHNK